ncbi:MAG: preprotein translocase subunit SecE [Candidatus Dactylopiibacterium carminicum]|uniref:Protein translocase subunit SecE n=1 Tax=Candidatus Dactylopiibacterium carminicum TaxID=857335 RepID=A0A272EN93_9RHOO|nr:preprotein translocase subunit SecE [Candidatus Dactylopiibacterium carminicum]KAF7599242.1 preprotein translocase subunit SecE [Candidatus Dactylopiibacterium carminicum]PAS91587.1 MAG: preprotein translocase subunit SecE [Candidatus Dactylopiibacterium carminicum]PAS93398.1 MAG: preprotein translocase subunit SecE [Candidatus Dactylopiibacterium carminicum]PAS99249.1 MAG: preprotein translocase subunit SecE [Candidatus Dactylopiibacterium carminicum]
MGDTLKFALAVLLVAAGLVGYYLLDGQATIFRVLSVLAGLGLGVAVGWYTAPGQRLVAFGGEAIIEAKKVVWPSKKETVQTTGVVFAFVVVMAIILWLVDLGVGKLIGMLLGWNQ